MPSKRKRPPEACLFEQYLGADQPGLIFVGGKGGVGKTTCSTALALSLSRAVRRKGTGKVLIVSTDPAHNLGDVLSQELVLGETTAVAGVEGLDALELNPTVALREFLAGDDAAASGGFEGEVMKDFKEWFATMPGIDEAMALTEVMKRAETPEYAAVVFDTAPTGHTLRLLSLPALLQKGIEHLQTLQAKYSGVLATLSGFLFNSAEQAGQQAAAARLETKLRDAKAAIDRVGATLRDPTRTVFCCVAVAEALSVLETCRLVEQLRHDEIACAAVIVNQLVPAPKEEQGCGLCTARRRIQGKHVALLRERLPALRLLEVPLYDEEMRGPEKLLTIAGHLAPGDATDLATGSNGGEAAAQGVDDGAPPIKRPRRTKM